LNSLEDCFCCCLGRFGHLPTQPVSVSRHTHKRQPRSPSACLPLRSYQHAVYSPERPRRPGKRGIGRNESSRSHPGRFYPSARANLRYVAPASPVLPAYVHQVRMRARSSARGACSSADAVRKSHTNFSSVVSGTQTQQPVPQAPFDMDYHVRFPRLSPPNAPGDARLAEAAATPS
jgi:hypothetical protein